MLLYLLLVSLASSSSSKLQSRSRRKTAQQQQAIAFFFFFVCFPFPINPSALTHRAQNNLLPFSPNSTPPPPYRNFPNLFLSRGGGAREEVESVVRSARARTSRSSADEAAELSKHDRGRRMRMRVLPALNGAAAAAVPPPPAPPPPTPAPVVKVFLNIYDISPINNYLYWFGLGIFHSGVEVHGMEFGYGAHEYPTSGVFQVEPKSCPGFIFRRSVCVGTTNMSRSEVRTFLEDLAEDYHGDTYHLIVKNCNHFTADVCKRLTGKPTPGWVNRLARLGSVCNCVLPENIKVSAVRDETAHLEFSDDGLESNASIVDDSDMDDLDHLLTTPNSDIVSSIDKTLTPGRDSL